MKRATAGRAPPPRSCGRVGAVLAGFALLASGLVGWGIAASTDLASGIAEVADGAYVGESDQTYWRWMATDLVPIPSPVPALASSTASAPTLLPRAGSSYVIQPATIGNQSVRWEFRERAAPGSTELEVRFVDGLIRPVVAGTIYLETQVGGHRGALLYYLYWDAGAYAPSSLSIATLSVTVLVCTSIGVCP